jgi:uncharacterized protein (DUF2384 family)
MKPKSISSRKVPAPRTAEPAADYVRATPALPAVRGFSFHDFRKIKQACPFSLAEWARMLHLSERTLQRHEQQQAGLSPIHAERALQIAELVKTGAATFGNARSFYAWLHSAPPAGGGPLSPALLESYSGIEAIRTQLHRIQQGLFA